MPARTTIARDPDGQARVSSRSLVTDSCWRLDGMRPGLRPRLLRIDWGFDLPDGSRLTDPRWTWWLDDARQFLWSLQVDPPPGRERIRARTVISRFGKLRILIRWMVGEGLHGFGSLDQGAAERFLHMVGNRPGRAGKRLSSPTRHAYANLLRALYLQRRKLCDPPPEAPPAADRASAVSGHAGVPLPFTPDAIAIPLLSAALRLIGQPADDVIALRDRAVPLYEMRRERGLSFPSARDPVLAVIAGFDFATIDGEDAPWHPPISGTRRVRFLVERIYDACFVTIAYLVGARVSEILALEAGCVEQHPAADGAELFGYLRGRISKTARHEAGEPHRWTAPPPVQRAIDVLERLSAPLRQRTGRTELWLAMPGHGLIDTRPVDVISANTVVVRLNRLLSPCRRTPTAVPGI